MRTLSVVLLVTICCASHALGQYPVPYYGVGSNNYHHASTVEEGAARGMADLVRSRGAANLMNSHAAKNFEDARKKYIENRLLRTQTYFDMKKINKQSRFGDQKRRTQADFIRYSQSKLPNRLNHAQLDPLTGTLKWPLLLRLKSLEPEREKLEKLFAVRAKEGYVGPDQFLEIQNAIKSMREETDRVVRDYPTDVTIAARKFLNSLAYEVKFPAG